MSKNRWLQNRSRKLVIGLIMQKIWELSSIPRGKKPTYIRFCVEDFVPIDFWQGKISDEMLWNRRNDLQICLMKETKEDLNRHYYNSLGYGYRDYRGQDLVIPPVLIDVDGHTIQIQGDCEEDPIEID